VFQPIHASEPVPVYPDRFGADGPTPRRATREPPVARSCRRHFSDRRLTTPPAFAHPIFVNVRRWLSPGGGAREPSHHGDIAALRPHLEALAARARLARADGDGRRSVFARSDSIRCTSSRAAKRGDRSTEDSDPGRARVIARNSLTQSLSLSD